ncbi:MAG: IcmT/TraK family protein [Rhodanobacter sp.]|jgi:hypothetical protein
MAEGRYHWSNASASARFGKINATTAIPLLVLLFFPGKTTAIIALITMGFFVYIEYWKKMDFFTAMRAAGVWLSGRMLTTLNNVKKFRVR